MGAVKISEVSKQCTGCGKTRALARFQTYRKNGYLCVKSRCRVARKGYVKGNVRLVCMAVNALRGSASDMEAYGIAKAFVQKWEESHGRA
jgi:hypothetical protein